VYAFLQSKPATCGTPHSQRPIKPDFHLRTPIKMPIRHARISDIPIMAQVLTASFGPDRLFQIMFPHQDAYPEDFVTAFRRKLLESWWDYSKVLMVSYETQTSKVEDLDDVKRALVTTRGGEKEVITGMIEWQRAGLGWEHVWNLWGWWDPSKFDQAREKTAHTTILVAPRVVNTSATKYNPNLVVVRHFLIVLTDAFLQQGGSS